jgi:glycosyltransferase involved in cell wall biosynthesis
MGEAMKKKPTVSVVMSVYNGEKYLRDSIESILNQTYKDFEFIIIDDGSTDRSKQIIQSYSDKRIRLISRENRGLVSSLNEAIGLARADYIARQDDDDVSMPTRLQKQYKFIQENPAYGLVGTRRQNISHNGSGLDVPELPIGDRDIRKSVYEYNPITHGSVFFDKQVFVKAGGYEEGKVPGEDYLLWVKMLEYTKAHNLPSIEYLYRLNPDGITQSHDLSARKNIEEEAQSFALSRPWTYFPQNGIGKRTLARVIIYGIQNVRIDVILYCLRYLRGTHKNYMSTSKSNNTINVLQVNTLDTKGGAAKSTKRLSDGLNMLEKTKSYIMAGTVLDDADTTVQFPGRILKRLAYGRDSLVTLGMRSFAALKKLNIWSSVSIVHLHNMHGGYFNLISLLRLAKSRPTIWTLHDPWIIYEYNTVPEYNEIFSKKRITRGYRLLKKITIPRVIKHVTFTSPSLWLKNKVLDVFPGADIRLIPNFIDTSIFKPTNQSEARKLLGLDLKTFYIMIVADDGEDNKSKGADALDRICQKSNGKITKLIIGGKDNYVKDEYEMALYYSAADLFVFPTRADNFPLVTLESMACGTPVVAYSVGGVPEQINHMKDGCLVAPGDEEKLAQYVAELASDKRRMKNMSQEAINKVNRLYNEDSVIKQYIDLYEEINGQT